MEAFTGTRPVAEQHAFDVPKLEAYLRDRLPGFSGPLLCPSMLPGIELERLADVAGLPAYAAPAADPWVYDGRIVVRARPQSGRRRL